MRYDPINPALFKSNRENYASSLLPGSLAIFNSNDQFPRSNDQPFPFRQNSDLFYLTGITQEKTILLIYPDCPNPNLREILFILKGDELLETWEGHKLTRIEATGISGIKKVMFLDDFDVILAEVMVYAENVYLNATEYIKYFNPVPYRDLRFISDLKEKYPNHNYKRSAPVMHKLRTIKSEEEIALIRKAIDITNKAFHRVLKSVKPGRFEFEVQADIEHQFMINRAEGSAYYPIIASGKNACALHYVSNDQLCNDGDLLLMDFGAEYACYAADITRTIPVNGHFSPRQRACYDAVYRVLQKAAALMVPGNTIDKLNQEVNKMMEQEMISLNLFSREQVSAQSPDKPLYSKYFMHGTSHFLGLDVHDLGSKYEPFKPGMVLTCEPGLYIAEEKIGIRLENNILVTENGPVNLSADIPVDPDEIEKLMSAYLE